MTINSLDQKQAESIIGTANLLRASKAKSTIEEIEPNYTGSLASNATTSKKTITSVTLKKDISLKSNVIVKSSKPSPTTSGQINPIVDDKDPQKLKSKA